MPPTKCDYIKILNLTVVLIKVFYISRFHLSSTLNIKQLQSTRYVRVTDINYNVGNHVKYGYVYVCCNQHSKHDRVTSQHFAVGSIIKKKFDFVLGSVVL